MKYLLVDKKFWMLVVGLVLLIMNAYVPSFNVDAELAVAYLIVIASYIVGVAVDEGNPGWRGVIKSRKFWAAAVGIVVLTLQGFGIVLPEALPADTLVWFAALLGSVIAGFALEAPFKKYFDS